VRKGNPTRGALLRYSSFFEDFVAHPLHNREETEDSPKKKKTKSIKSAEITKDQKKASANRPQRRPATTV
jgi:hypothetical protein